MNSFILEPFISPWFRWVNNKNPGNRWWLGEHQHSPDHCRRFQCPRFYPGEWILAIFRWKQPFAQGLRRALHTQRANFNDFCHSVRVALQLLLVQSAFLGRNREFGCVGGCLESHACLDNRRSWDDHVCPIYQREIQDERGKLFCDASQGCEIGERV